MGIPAWHQHQHSEPEHNAAMNNINQGKKLKAIISKHYDLGELVNYEQLTSGFINVSNIIEIKSHGKKKRYFLRRYKPGIKEEEINFEHSVINHLNTVNFQLTACVIQTRNGKNYVKKSERGENVFYAVFDLLKGDDKYTWVNPNCSDEDLKASAAVLARFHDAIFDLSPNGRRYEPKIIDFLPEIALTIEQCAQNAGTTVFDVYFLENTNTLQKTIQRILRVMEKDEYKALLELVIHCDYHPGNLKFQNNEITGLFDFDWSKVDLRCFDVALAMTYFCVTWEGIQDGNLELSKVAKFLDAYQNMLRDAADIKPMCDVELNFLPVMMGASNIYILNWTIGNYYSTEVNAHEYLIYLRHSVRFLKWLEDKDNWEQLIRTINN